MTEGMDANTPESNGKRCPPKNRLERLELIEAIVRGLEAVQAGNVVDNREAMCRLKKIALASRGT
jgi:hypothetical protein